MAFLLLGLLPTLLLADGGNAAEPSFFETGPPRSAAEKLASESLLRLTDMPAGFVLGAEDFCGEPRDELENEGIYEVEEHLPPTPEEAFIKKTGSVLCTVTYNQLYGIPRAAPTPEKLISFALTTPSAKAAAEGLAVGPELMEDTLFTRGFSTGAAPALGEEARQYDTVQGRTRRLRKQPGVLLLWRQGREIGGVFAIAPNPDVAATAARTYATLQQGYLASPRPLLADEAEDLSTFLDNPDLKVPVYWLGRTFSPKDGPTSYFESAWTGEAFGAGPPGRELSTFYSDGLFLDTWTPGGWAKFSKTALGREQWSWHCTRSESVKLPHGHAVIYDSYRRDDRTCPSRPPDHFSAHVFLPGVVIAIDEPLFRGSEGNGAGGFESWAGLKTVARALRLYRAPES